MTWASTLSKLIEEVLNPEDTYHTTAVRYGSKPEDVSHNDFSWAKPAHEALSKEADSKFPNASSDDKRFHALSGYTSMDYGGMNRKLRKNSREDSGTSAKIKNLKKLTGNTTQHEFNVYRNAGEGHFEDLTEGNIFKDKGFVSTSLTPSRATGHQNKNQKFRIHVTPGTKGYYAGGSDASMHNEHEFILHPGTTFRVGKTFMHKSGHEFTNLHVHSQED